MTPSARRPWLPALLLMASLPDADVDLANRPPFNAAANLCQKLFTDAGIVKDAARAGFIFCDFARMIEAGASEAAHDQSHADWLARGIEAIGGHYQSAVGFASVLTPAKHDSLAALQGMRFEGGCNCWKYVGSPERAPLS